MDFIISCLCGIFYKFVQYKRFIAYVGHSIMIYSAVPGVKGN